MSKFFLQGLRVYHPRLLFACHGETSGGVAQPLEGIGELCARFVRPRTQGRGTYVAKVPP